MNFHSERPPQWLGTRKKKQKEQIPRIFEARQLIKKKKRKHTHKNKQCTLRKRDAFSLPLTTITGFKTVLRAYRNCLI